MSILVGIEWLTITENKRRKEEPINAKQNENERAALPAHKAFREKHRQTDGQTQTDGETQKYEQTERQTDRLTDRETQTETERHAWKDRHTNIQRSLLNLCLRIKYRHLRSNCSLEGLNN